MPISARPGLLFWRAEARREGGGAGLPMRVVPAEERERGRLGDRSVKGLARAFGRPWLSKAAASCAHSIRFARYAPGDQATVHGPSRFVVPMCAREGKEASRFHTSGNCQGSRRLRSSIWLASGSLRNCSACGSHLSLRPNRNMMLARWHTVLTRWPISTGK